MNITTKFENEENLKTAELVNSVVDSNSDNILDLFPEFDLSGLIGLYKEGGGIANYVLLFDRVVVSLRPFADEKSFANAYGITIQEFSKLIDLGKVLVVVCYPYSEFGELYDVLKLERFPRSGRTRKYFSSLQGFAENDHIQRVQAIASFSKYEDYKRTVYYQKSADVFYASYGSDIFDLELLGLNDVVSNIYELADIDPIMAHKVAVDYCNLVARPFFECLGGVCNFDNSDRVLAKSLYLPVDQYALGTKKHFDANAVTSIGKLRGIHPADLTLFFPEEIAGPNLHVIDDIGSFVEAVDKDHDVLEFRAKLFELSGGNKNANELVEIGKAINDKLKSDARALKIVNGTLRTVLNFGSLLPTAATVGASVNLTPLTSCLIGVGVASVNASFNPAIATLSEKVTEKLAKTALKKPILASYTKVA